MKKSKQVPKNIFAQREAKRRKVEEEEKKRRQEAEDEEKEEQELALMLAATRQSSFSYPIGDEYNMRKLLYFSFHQSRVAVKNLVQEICEKKAKPKGWLRLAEWTQSEPPPRHLTVEEKQKVFSLRSQFTELSPIHKAEEALGYAWGVSGGCIREIIVTVREEGGVVPARKKREDAGACLFTSARKQKSVYNGLYFFAQKYRYEERKDGTKPTEKEVTAAYKALPDSEKKFYQDIANEVVEKFPQLKEDLLMHVAELNGKISYPALVERFQYKGFNLASPDTIRRFVTGRKRIPKN